MKQTVFSKVLTVIACTLMLCVLVPMFGVADQAQYIYDDLGRLAKVIDGQSNVATYTYDAVGNLLSITRNTGGVGAPTITGLTPNTGNAGASVTVSLTGTNLTGAALATDNPGILVRNIAATFQMSFAARTGATAVTVTTVGSAAATSLTMATTVVGMTPDSVLFASRIK